MSEPSVVCVTCGAPLVEGQCERCGRGWSFRFVHREIVILGVLSILAVVTFIGTRNAANSNRELLVADAAIWFERGQGALSAGSADEAVEALRQASTRFPDNHDYRLAFGQSLAQAGQDDLARVELLALRDEAPESPEINVALARVEARAGNFDEAVRYYESSLYGLWPVSAFEERSQLRVEFIRYLLGEEESSAALSETLALIPNMPIDVDWDATAADLFMAAGDPTRALEQYVAALEQDGSHEAALAGAGAATFALDDFAAARGYLADAPDDFPGVALLRTITDFVLTQDPLAARLSADERGRRLTANIEAAHARLDQCRETTEDEELALLTAELDSFASVLTPAEIRQSTDIVEAGVDLVARIEQVAGAVCADATELDEALIVIGRLYAADAS